MITISISPIAFTIGSMGVRWYGIIVALAILVIVLWMLRAVRRGANLSYNTVFTAALVGIPSGVVISRLLHVVDLWDYYSQNLGQIIRFDMGGLTIYGAILGAALGIWIYSRFSKSQFGYLADLIMPGLILAQVVGRIGCTVNGCCYGLPTSLPWGIVYTHSESVAYAASRALPPGTGLHPTQPYEIIYLLIIFGVVLMLRRRFRPDGSLFLVYLGLYSVWRIGIDFLREGTPFLFGLHQAQVIAIIVLAITISLLAYKTRWVKAEGDAER